MISFLYLAALLLFNIVVSLTCTVESLLSIVQAASLYAERLTALRYMHKISAHFFLTDI